MTHKHGVRLEEQSDAELLVLAPARSEVMGVIYERHAPAVFRYLSRRVGAEAAEDLLGEVFVAAVASRSRVGSHVSGSALPWLYGIAGNVIRTHLRRTPAHSDVDVALQLDWDAVDARIDAGARRQELRAALTTLTDKERELLLLVAWEGLSPAEAADALGLTAVAARSRLHRARTKAQEALAALSEATG